MTHRIGKVKIFTEEGKLIREGLMREDDLSQKKIFGMFEPAELVRAAVIIIVACFTAGGLWVNSQNHFDALDRDNQNFINLFADFKKDEQSFHRTVFDRMDSRDARINCVEDSLKGCCPSAQNC
jgi:hypothetical protein